MHAPNCTTRKRKFDSGKSLYVPHVWDIEDEPPASGPEEPVSDQEQSMGGDEQSMGGDDTSDNQDDSQDQPRLAWDGIKRYLDHLYDLPPRDLKEYMGKGLLVTAQVMVTNDDSFTLDVKELSTLSVAVYCEMPPSEENADALVDQFWMFHSALIPLSLDVRKQRKRSVVFDLHVDSTTSDESKESHHEDSDDESHGSDDSEESEEEEEVR
jgi:hypothetical protein